MLPRGAGTSLAGQCCNVAVVLDFTKYMNRILEIDPGQRIRARPAGRRPGHAAKRGGSRIKLTFGPDPSTHSRCTLGGMIGNNSCGTHSLLAGKTVDNVEELRHSAVRRHAADRRRDRATPSSTRSSAAAAAAARSTPALRDIRDRYADRIRERFPAHSAARVRLQPRRAAARERLSRRARARRQRRHVRDRARSKAEADSRARSTGRWSASDTATRSRPPITFRRFSSSVRSASKDSKASMVDGLRKKGAPNLELAAGRARLPARRVRIRRCRRSARERRRGSSSG